MTRSWTPSKLVEQVEAAAQTDPGEPPVVAAPEKKSL